MVGSVCTFSELKNVQNGSNHSIFRKIVFYKQVLEFHRPSKFVCQTSGRQNHWSLLHMEGMETNLTRPSVLGNPS
jgi:hypothetical protein